MTPVKGVITMAVRLTSQDFELGMLKAVECGNRDTFTRLQKESVREGYPELARASFETFGRGAQADDGRPAWEQHFDADEKNRKNSKDDKGMSEDQIKGLLREIIGNPEEDAKMRERARRALKALEEDENLSEAQNKALAKMGGGFRDEFAFCDAQVMAIRGTR
jgi:hypothetical protein